MSTQGAPISVKNEDDGTIVTDPLELFLYLNKARTHTISLVSPTAASLTCGHHFHWGITHDPSCTADADDVVARLVELMESAVSTSWRIDLWV